MPTAAKSLTILVTLLLILTLTPAPATVENEVNTPNNLDELFLALETEIAGFAGFYIENDTLVVVSSAAFPSANVLKQTIANELADLRPQLAQLALADRIRVVVANFSFRQLYSIKEALTLDPPPKTALIDVDERRNRVLIGVEDEDAVEDVLRHLSDKEVPLDSVSVEVVGPITPLATLRDRIRPVAGGLQIAWPLNPPYIGVCTLGFIAIRDGVLGYVTNDHCTSQSGVVDGTVHHQNIPDNAIGVETVDPPFFTTNCPPGYLCRYSDAAFGRALSAPDLDFGKLMRTAGLNSLDIAGRWSIVSETGFPVTGEILNKVGRTTGWTQGSVTGTCANLFVYGTNWVRLCQDIVSADVDGGDSGSPVFKVVDSATGTVSLYGVLWGGGGAGFVFSNMRNIERELGQLTTFGYSVTFQRTGIPSGVEWGVTVNGYRYTSTGSSITVPGLSDNVDYFYDGVVPDPSPNTRYVCDAGCSGTISGSTIVTASYVTEYRLVFRASNLSVDALGNVLKVNGVDYGYGSLPASMWFRSGSVVNYEYYLFVSSSLDGKRYRWAGVSGMSQTGRSGSFTVTGGGELNGHYIVEFRLDISTNPPSLRLTIPPPGSYWYESGSLAVVRSFNKPLIRFEYWLLDGTRVDDDNIVVRMDGPHTLVAVFTSGSSCFDFGRLTSPVQPGCIGVTHTTGYTSYLGYGWLSKRSLESAVRGQESNRLLMDFVHGVGRAVFAVDVPNGPYRVTVIVGDKIAPQTLMEAVVEGTPLTLSARRGDYVSVVALVEVLDGRLEIRFYGYGRTWRVNAVIIEPLS